MTIGSGGGAAAALQSASGGSEIGLKMLKKANEQSGQQLQLIESLPKAGNLPGVGGGLDVTA